MSCEEKSEKGRKTRDVKGKKERCRVQRTQITTNLHPRPSPRASVTYIALSVCRFNPWLRRHRLCLHHRRRSLPLSISLSSFRLSYRSIRPSIRLPASPCIATRSIFLAKSHIPSYLSPSLKIRKFMPCTSVQRCQLDHFEIFKGKLYFY